MIFLCLNQRSQSSNTNKLNVIKRSTATLQQSKRSTATLLQSMLSMLFAYLKQIIDAVALSLSQVLIKEGTNFRKQEKLFSANVATLVFSLSSSKTLTQSNY